MKATEGNGGAPIIISREPIERPEIPRGLMNVAYSEILIEHDLDTITFAQVAPKGQPFLLTYHRVRKAVDEGPFVGVNVWLDVVVTWERIEPAGGVLIETKKLVR